MLRTAKEVQLGNYAPAPFVLTRGCGRRVTDASGREYLDLSGGIAVLSVGHSHPTLSAAIAEQSARLMHVSNVFYNDRAIELAQAICARTPFDKVYFCNSGSEANESLLKLARRYHHDRGDQKRTEFVSTLNSFHGRTMGSLSLTGQRKYHLGMEPLVQGVSFVDFNDLAALDAAVTDRTAAVIFEPVQAEGGIIIGTEEFVSGARRICDERGALLFFDEIQTGYGRTGRFCSTLRTDPRGPARQGHGRWLSTGGDGCDRAPLRRPSSGEPRQHLWRKPARLCCRPCRAAHHR